MTKTSLYCYEKNGGACKNRISLANNYICSAGHGGLRQTSSVSSTSLTATPAIDLSKMSFSQRYDLARDPSTAAETLSKLAGDKEIYTRQNVARNTSTSPETLAQMAEDEDWHIRQSVANNTSASPETHIYLAEQGHPPYGFTMSKSINELTKEIELVNQYPYAFGGAYLHRLLDYSTPEDKTHPKRRALIGYVYGKYAKSETSDWIRSNYKIEIRALFPDDQEMAEMIGY